MPEQVLEYGPYLGPLVLVVLVLLLYGSGERVRDVVFSIVSALVAVAAGVLAWYAWTESQSVAWSASYAVLCAAALAACVRWVRRAAVGQG